MSTQHHFTIIKLTTSDRRQDMRTNHSHLFQFSITLQAIIKDVAITALIETNKIINKGDMWEILETYEDDVEGRFFLGKDSTAAWNFVTH